MKLKEVLSQVGLQHKFFFFDDGLNFHIRTLFTDSGSVSAVDSKSISVPRSTSLVQVYSVYGIL